MAIDYESLRSDYLDLLKKYLTASLYPESGHSPIEAIPGSRTSRFVRRALARTFGILALRKNLENYAYYAAF